MKKKYKIKITKKTFIKNIINVSKNEKRKITIVNVLPFEQNVNLNYFYLTLTDFFFLKFSNLKIIWNLKNLSKISHSSILRKKFFVNFSIFKKIEKFMILYNFYFYKNKNYKTKINLIYNN